MAVEAGYARATASSSLGAVARSLATMGWLVRDDAGRVRLHFIALVRWIAVVGQLFTLLFVHFSIGIELPLLALLPAVALSALVNLALHLRFSAATRLSDRTAALLFGYDIVQLAYLLELTGGLQNPFAILLLLPVAIAASTLARRWALAITILALACVALLALYPTALPWRAGGLRFPPLYLVGAWTALSLGVVLVAAYAWSVAEDARRRATALAATQLALAREQELSALGGQAAAAAHLLGSPLGTIAVIAKELVRELPADSPLRAEARELLEQAGRCRDILRTLGRRDVDPGQDRFTRAPLSTLLETLTQEFGREGVRCEVRVEPLDGVEEPVVAPMPELRHSLANLIDNAVRFARSQVCVTVRPSRAGLELVIEDDGPGFSPEVLDWLGEPYLSTRHGEGGLGLGIFIAMTLLARNGGKLHVANKLRGARVTVSWPARAFDEVTAEATYERRRS